MKPDILAATFDLARCARSDRFKLIYNCTPHGAVAPVDSQGDPGWTEMKTANAAGKLDPVSDNAFADCEELGDHFAQVLLGAHVEILGIEHRGCGQGAWDC